MAVSRMRKIQLLAHKSAKAEVIAALREGGVLHVSEPSVEIASAEDEERRERERRLAARLAKLEYLRTYLKPHAPKRKPLEAMFNPKFVLSHGELDEIMRGLDVDALYERVTSIEADIRRGEAELGRKETLAAELAHWEMLDLPVEQVGDTRLTRVALLSVDSSEVPALVEEISSEGEGGAVIPVGSAGSTTYAVAIFLKSSEGVVAPVLKRHGARAVDLSGAAGRPALAAEALLEEARELRESVGKLEDDAAGVAEGYERILAALDETSEQLAKASVEDSFSSTRDTFLVEGWIRGRDEEALRSRLGEISSETHMVARDPEDGESVPIDLRNNGAVAPFEFVTTLYGRPTYWEFDPTPLLAPFFVVFFGLCVSDGGYGAVLAAVSFILMKKMQPGGGRKLMKLLFMGGLATAAVGALTGGWFGIEGNDLPWWIQTVRLRLGNGDYFSPLMHPMHMLDFVFLLGIVQIFTGLAVKMVAEFREKRWLDGILDQLVWIVFLTFLAPLGANFILGKDLSPEFLAVARKGAIIMGLIVVLTGARKNRNPVMKVLGGVLKLYDVVGYFGDVLSYARLLALGLVSDSFGLVNPLRPPNCLIVSNSSHLPFISLWG